MHTLGYTTGRADSLASFLSQIKAPGLRTIKVTDPNFQPLSGRKSGSFETPWPQVRDLSLQLFSPSSGGMPDIRPYLALFPDAPSLNLTLRALDGIPCRADIAAVGRPVFSAAAVRVDG